MRCTARSWCAPGPRATAAVPSGRCRRARPWQPELWRRLRERIGRPDPAERIAGACARIAAEPELLDLPPRLSVFGLTRLPAARLDVLRALAAAREVHLFLLHPSPALWARIAEDPHGPVASRRTDPTAALPRNRLLASWGNDVRELQLVLERAGEHVAHHHAAPPPAPSLLAAIQAGIRDDATPPGPPLPGVAEARPLLDPEDRSVRIHACHGRARQVEVLRDAVLHALADDPTLEPRDVIVMCPDIEAFAPLIHAAFGTGEQEPFLQVRLADRALRQTNPLLGVVARLLELAGERLTASQVLDLADRPPVRRRFRFDDDELARAEEWVREAGVRWGLDAADREPYKLERLAAGTWRAGLDRLLAGVALADEELWAGVLPLGVESGAIDLAGRLAELLDRLGAVLAALRRPQPLAAWAEALAEAADALTAAPERDAWQRGELERLLADLVEEAEGAEPVDLVLEEVRALLADRLQGRPTRANFRTGHLTICTLVPMRSVPHRVVCLLGLDDAAFPRKAPRDGDDLLLDDPHVGEPRRAARGPPAAARRADGRLGPAADHLHGQRRAHERGAAARRAGRRAARHDRPHGPARRPTRPRGARWSAAIRCSRSTRRTSSHGDPWSFDRVTLEGAEALTGPRTEPAPFLPAPLPPVAAPVVELDDLVRFAERPVRQFLRGRLGVRLAGDEEEADDALPVELDHLDQWRVGQQLLEARLRGVGDGRRGGGRARARRAAARRARGRAARAAAPDRRDDRPARARAPARRGAHGGRAGRAARRPGAQRRRAGRDRRAAADGRVRPGEPAQPHRRVGAAARTRRRAPRHGVGGGDGRPAAEAGCARGRGAHRRADRGAAARRPRRSTSRRCWTSTTAACASRCRSPAALRPPTRTRWRRAATPEKAARGAWESGWRFPQEDAEPEHRLVLRRRRAVRGAARGAGAPRRGLGRGGAVALRPSCAPPRRPADLGRDR